jgi:hypothetical protein
MAQLNLNSSTARVEKESRKLTFWGTSFNLKFILRQRKQKSARLGPSRQSEEGESEENFV